MNIATQSKPVTIIVMEYESVAREGTLKISHKIAFHGTVTKATATRTDETPKVRTKFFQGKLLRSCLFKLIGKRYFLHL